MGQSQVEAYTLTSTFPSVRRRSAAAGQPLPRLPARGAGARWGPTPNPAKQNIASRVASFTGSDSTSHGLNSSTGFGRQQIKEPFKPRIRNIFPLILISHFSILLRHHNKAL